MGTIMGTYEFKLPGGVTLNYAQFADRASEEMNEIYEWLQRNHAADYFFNTNSIQYNLENNYKQIQHNYGGMKL